jgi:hypothetical protein
VLLPDGIQAIAVDINGVTVRAKVVNNVAILSTRGATKLGASPAMSWYGASGRVIRQIPAHG